VAADPLHRRFRRCVRAVNRFVYDRIEERLAGGGDYDDILSSLIRSYGDDAPMMKRELRDQVVTLFFAGFETTGTALAWTWLLLSENPDAQHAIHEEVDRVLAAGRPGTTTSSRSATPGRSSRSRCACTRRSTA